MVRNLVAATVVAVVCSVVAAAELKSGPQVGAKVPGPFHPLHINGEDAGKTGCLYCSAGDDPVVAIFARTPSDTNLHKLVKTIDAETVKHAKADMHSFAVFSGDKAKLEPALKDVAKKAELKKTILAIELSDDPIPAKYALSNDADITVILYVDRVVKANYSFAKGKLTEKDIDAVVKDIAKITNK
jgi:hypothetical protein